ncbi:MAG TPA: hypothetical protein VGE74_00010 [Gemmata sp.]
MTTADVQQLLVRLAARDRASAAADPVRYPTPACVPLSRLFAWVENGDATGVDQAHLAQCAYCQAAAQKLRAPAPPLPEPPPLPPDEPAVPSEIFARHNVWVRPEVPWANSFRSSTAAPGTAPAQPVMFALGAGAGGNVALTPELAARYYDPPLAEVELKLVLVPVAGGWEPRVQLDPAPNRGDALVLTLTFPDGAARAFLVPSGPPGSLDAATSEPGEVLPAATAAATAAGWQGTVELT